MKGPVVPVVMIPRFTSYVGAGVYTTVPLELAEQFTTMTLTIWRGQLAGGVGSSVTILVEQAMDAASGPWMTLDTISTADDVSVSSVGLSQRYVRVSVELSGPNAALTCWAAGTLEKRLP